MLIVQVICFYSETVVLVFFIILMLFFSVDAAQKYTFHLQRFTQHHSLICVCACVWELGRINGKSISFIYRIVSWIVDYKATNKNKM